MDSGDLITGVARQEGDGMQRRIAELRARLRSASPAVLATCIGATHRPQEGELELALFGDPIVITTTDWRVLDGHTREAVSPNTEAMLLYHLATTDGSPVTERWISFRELPGGGFYHQAFQGYTGKELVKHFRNRLGAFERAAEELNGRQEGVGDAAYAFQALPRVPLMVVYWLGDEDFPPSARVLFDASAGRHLPTDAFALLGSTLTRRLIATDLRSEQ
jgi:hypothetical protein